MSPSNSSQKPEDMRRAGYTFMASGAAFLVAALLAKQWAFIGVAASMFGVGIAFVAKARQKS